MQVVSKSRRVHIAISTCVNTLYTVSATSWYCIATACCLIVVKWILLGG